MQPSTQCRFTAICSTCQVSAIVYATRISKTGAVGAPCPACWHHPQRYKNVCGPTLMVQRPLSSRGLDQSPMPVLPPPILSGSRAPGRSRRLSLAKQGMPRLRHSTTHGQQTGRCHVSVHQSLVGLRWLHTHFEPAHAGKLVTVTWQPNTSAEGRVHRGSFRTKRPALTYPVLAKHRSLRIPRNSVAHAKFQKHKTLNGPHTSRKRRTCSNTYTTTSYKGTKGTASVYR